uniref:Tetratricopeptide repeat protein n=1 Tax=Prevotella sp. GTC17254 TaxID=3236794 RepID=A0AB33J0G8_9BACT
MKAIKYLLVGALMVGTGAPVMAQNEKAAIEQVNKLLQSNSPDKAKQLKDIVKTYKKNPEVLVGIGRAYLDIQDTANAQVYADMALKRDMKYGPAFILCGDIQVLKDNGGAASSWYEQATFVDPKNPEGYRKYAQINSKVSPSSSVAMLNKLHENLPDYPVDLISAQIYDKAGNLSKAIEYYDKVDKSKMEATDLVSYSLNNFLKGDFEKSLSISQFGNNKFPRHPALNRISFFNLTNLKRYPEALTYADRLFNQSDSTKITESDYLYYGYAYQGNKEYQKAIDMFKQSLANNKDNDADKSDALKNIASAYSEMGDIANATKTYDEYLKSLKQITAIDYNTLANMYMSQASKTTGAEQKEAYANADRVFGEMAEKFASAADFATYQRAHIGYALDPETKTGAAKPHYEKLIEIIKSHTEKGDRDDARLLEAYQYLGYYYTLKSDKATADTYWSKMLEIDPNNETAKQALGK